MKTTYLLTTLIVAAFPLSIILAEDSAKTEMAGQNEGEKSAAVEMKGMDMSQKMSEAKEHEAELDKLVAAMNNAPADQKLDAMAAVLNKLVEQRKATEEEVQKLVGANHKEGMGMCRTLGCESGGKHSTRH
jgi:hypothetical protein